MAAPNSTYARHIAKTDNYTVVAQDDVVTFTITTPKTATLPNAANCTAQNQSNEKQIINSSNSIDTLTIAAPSGNNLIGIGSLAAGQIANLFSNGTVDKLRRGRPGWHVRILRPFRILRVYRHIRLQWLHRRFRLLRLLRIQWIHWYFRILWLQRCFRIQRIQRYLRVLWNLWLLRVQWLILAGTSSGVPTFKEAGYANRRCCTSGNFV